MVFKENLNICLADLTVVFQLCQKMSEIKIKCVEIHAFFTVFTVYKAIMLHGRYYRSNFSDEISISEMAVTTIYLPIQSAYHY
jgi:hypothetical protein